MIDRMVDELLALVGPGLREDVARCAAAAGYRMVVGDAGDCRRAWLTARAVVIDATAVDVLATALPPRRPGLLLVCAAEPPGHVWRTALDLGADDVANLPADDGRLVRALTRLRAPVRRRGDCLAIIGAHGGAGTSTLAAAVALTGARTGTRTLLLDLDDLGAGADLLLGVEDRAGLRWGDLSLDGGLVSAGALHQALPAADEWLSVLAPAHEEADGLRVDAVTAVIDAGTGDGDLVVVDLPRRDGAVVTAALASADLVVLLTSATVPGAAAARRTAGRLLADRPDAELVIRGPAPGGLRADALAEAVGMPLLAAYRPDPRLPGRAERDRLRLTARSPLGRAAHTIHRRLTSPGRGQP